MTLVPDWMVIKAKTKPTEPERPCGCLVLVPYSQDLRLLQSKTQEAAGREAVCPHNPVCLHFQGQGALVSVGQS